MIRRLTNGCPPNQQIRLPFIKPCAIACSPAANAFGPFWPLPPRVRFLILPTELRMPLPRSKLIHTYSLIHDDLPALDNDDLRRGRPTCHKVFGEAMAILAGDSLLTLAFEVLGRLPLIDAERKIRLVEELARASGTVGGMIGGQVNDIEGEKKAPTAFLLESIHRAKTGALLRASLRMGAIYAGATAEELAALSEYGEHVGLAFQIIDDVLDVEASSEKLAKQPVKTPPNKRSRSPLFTVWNNPARWRKKSGWQLTQRCTPSMIGADRLRQIADFIVQRKT